jgi:type I restriction enzyme S subunit
MESSQPTIKESYKQTDAGVIPEDWEVKTLEDVCVPSGLIRGPFGGALKKEFFVETGYKVYEQRNAIYRNPTIGRYYIDGSKFQELKRFEVKENDFIVSCSGTIGRIYQIPKTAAKGVINQALLIIKTDKYKIDDKYFFYYFDWERFQTKIVDNTQGGAMPNLVGMNIFRETPIPLPPLPEQQAIAEVLSDMDALITSLDQLITKKRNIKHGTMQLLLMGKKRLAGFSSNWETKEIGNDIDLLTGYPFPSNKYSSDGIRLLRGSNIKRGITDWSDDLVTYWKEITPELERYSCKEGDIVIAMDGSLVGKSYARLSQGDVPSLLLQRVARIRSKKIDLGYLKEFIGSKYFSKYCDSVKTVTAIPHISSSDIRNFKIQIPPTTEEQQAIAQILSEMDAEIEALEKKREKYKAIKQGMMQELLTGKTRLV